MRIKDGFVLKEIAGSYIVVPLRERIESFSAVINLNETSALLWKSLSKDLSEDELVQILLDSYDVDKTKAIEDVHDFVIKLKNADLIEE